MTVRSSPRRRSLPDVLLIAVVVLVWTMSARGAAQGTSETVAAERVVVAFNKAITDRRVDEAVAVVAEGAVQFAIAPPHAFGAGASAGQPALTSNLEQSWRTVLGVLSAVTQRYERRVLRMETRIDDRVATVWASIRTESVPRDATDSTVTEFGEVYLLRRTTAGWQIVGIANGRPTR